MLCESVLLHDEEIEAIPMPQIPKASKFAYGE